jgi:hypothetical protein
MQVIKIKKTSYQLISPRTLLILGQKPEIRKEIHVLSLDGGGSRGIMESIMLGHIMNLATIMRDNPEKIINPDQNIIDEIENHPNPIHPTEAFQYIVGKFDSKIMKHF